MSNYSSFIPDATAQQVLEVANFSRDYYLNYDAAHDFDHIERVVVNARKIGEEELPELLNLVLIGAYLHDVGDYKFHTDSESEIKRVLQNLQDSAGLTAGHVALLEFVISNCSFSKGYVPKNTTNKDLLLQIIQDADRLDAIGAIGIARTFAYGGYKKQPIYKREILPNTAESKLNPTTYNHFFEKLLHLKTGMHTHTGKLLAAKRHEFMELFVNQFNLEINI